MRIEKIKNDNIIISTLSSIVLPIILIFGLYIHFRGDDASGGGFQSGMIVACFAIMHSLIFGIKNTTKFITIKGVKTGCIMGFLIYFVAICVSIFCNNVFISQNVGSMQNIIQYRHIFLFVIELGVGITVYNSMFYMYYSILTFCENAQKTKLDLKNTTKKN